MLRSEPTVVAARAVGQLLDIGAAADKDQDLTRPRGAPDFTQGREELCRMGGGTFVDLDLAATFDAQHHRVAEIPARDLFRRV